MNLNQVSGFPSGVGAADVPVLCVVRNERKIISHFLRHYREGGIQQFVFVDNDSTDGTREFLLEQSDCAVFRTGDHYQKANFGVDWINSLAGRYFAGEWILHVDCDEHLIFPAMDQTSVSDFCHKIDADGYDSVYAVMVDMYADKSHPAPSFSDDDCLADIMPFFDTEYLFRRWPFPPWKKPEQFPLEIVGGPRCRLLSDIDKEGRKDWPSYLFMNLIDRFVDHVPKNLLPLLFRYWPRPMPAHQKRPLNKVIDGFRFTNSHSATNYNVSPVMVSLLHYKLAQDLETRAQFDINFFLEHYRRGMHLQQLKTALEAWNGDSLVYEGSGRFTGPEDLERAGLIGDAVSRVWMRKDSRVVAKTGLQGPTFLGV